MLDKYGKHDDEGKLIRNKAGVVEFEADQYQKFLSEHSELLDVEVECEKIRIADLEGRLELSASDLVTLDELLTD